MSDVEASQEAKHLAHVYRKLKVRIVRGKGATLWDSAGQAYIDCMSAYGVAIIGHSHPRLINAIKNQADRLIMCHASVFNDAREELLSKLSGIAPKGLDSIFLSNSGAESIEAAIKASVKYTKRKVFVSMMGAFHGKTLGALSLTWNPRYRKAFQDMLYPDVKFARYGNADSLRQIVNDEVAAIFVEPIQGESGVHLPPNGYLRQVKELSEEHGALMVFDEVQTGLGRTGRLWAHQHEGVIPDMMCIAKGLGGGVPIGATLAREEIMNSLEIGEHSSTFGANPLSCAAASQVLDIIHDEDLPRAAEESGRYLMERLGKLMHVHDNVREVRGRGLMVGVEMRFNVQKFLDNLVKNGILPLYSGLNVVRLLPPLIINRQQIDDAVEIIDKTLGEANWSS